jgi:predicted transcriptional regulator
MSFIMDKIKTPQMLGAAFHKMRSEGDLRASKIAQRAGRSRDILYRLESGKDISVSALLDLLRATGHAIQIVPAGLPTMEQMRAMFKEETDDGA